MGMRILLLLTISWIVGLTAPVFTFADNAFSWRDLILIVGGFFLLWKATTEIGELLEGEAAMRRTQPAGTARFGAVLVQIMLLDIVFSLDSVLTAVGMANEIVVMVAAVVIAVGVMLVASGPLATFVRHHPTVKMLALAFLLLIGVTLVADGFGFHIDKAYIYVAMGFSVFVEGLNLRARLPTTPGAGPPPPDVREGRTRARRDLGTAGTGRARGSRARRREGRGRAGRVRARARHRVTERTNERSGRTRHRSGGSPHAPLGDPAGLLGPHGPFVRRFGHGMTGARPMGWPGRDRWDGRGATDGMAGARPMGWPGRDRWDGRGATDGMAGARPMG